jgi:hypothetical protein
MTTWTLPDALQLLHQQYPGAFVTSGARDPSSALGKANPRSYHNVGEAFDIRPMPGVDFNSYVSSLKSAGLPVVEALDEAKHPKPWTTGPNWHVAFAGENGKVATSPIDLIKRAQAFNVDIPQQAMPPAGGPMSAAAPAAPQGGFDLQAALAQLAASKQPLEEKKKVPMWLRMVGALADSYGQVNGREATFLPSLARQNELVDSRNADREKLNAQIHGDQVSLLQKLLEPPQYIQNAQAWQGLSPEQRRAVLEQQDAVNPIVNTMPDGPHLQPRTSTKVINGKTYYSIGGQWFEEGE